MLRAENSLKKRKGLDGLAEAHAVGKDAALPVPALASVDALDHVGEHELDAAILVLF